MVTHKLYLSNQLPRYWLHTNYSYEISYQDNGYTQIIFIKSVTKIMVTHKLYLSNQLPR